ncbi:toll/interleukin-1 receptor domain-containing protein [Gemmatimonas sp.]|uniref:toll/interleukin-1 receptor domain-containing protein n=1 Tax=Gemmatimonas sp. TaxID=1962908 RepID=UPI00356779FD
MREHDTSPNLVGNVFSAVRDLVLSGATLESETPESVPERLLERVRIPLLATGDQESNRGDMLEAIIRQAYLILIGQLPVRRVEIVLQPNAPDLHQLLVRAGRAVEQVRAEWTQHHPAVLASLPSTDFDFFVSYWRTDASRVDPVIKAMRRIKPGLRLFIDREQLTAGRLWKADLMSGLARSRRALCFITDGYADSPECMDEFHASLCISRECSRSGFLRPILRLNTRLVERLFATLSRIHCIDARPPELHLDEVARMVLHGKCKRRRGHLRESTRARCVAITTS